MKKNYKLFLPILILLYFSLSNQIFGKTNDTTIVAKIKLVTKFNTKNNKPIAALSVTFTNTSDENIYIPELFNTIRSAPIGGKIKKFVKKINNYVPDGFVGSSLPIKPFYGSTVSGSRSEIIDKYFSVVKQKGLSQDSILQAFEVIDRTQIKRNSLEPLFLKAHEEYEINLIKDVDYLITIPGEFKIFYELDFSLTDKNPYPKEIQGYHLFIPNKLISNVLYLKVEP